MSTFGRVHFRVYVALLALVCGCETQRSEANGEAGPATDSFVRFVPPDPEVPLSGLAELKLEAHLTTAVSELALLLDGQEIAEVRGLPMALKFDTTRAQDGMRELSLRARAEDGEIYTDRIDLEFDNPEHRLRSAELSQSTYGRGETIVLDLEYSAEALRLSADFSALDSGFQASAVRTAELGGGRYRIEYTISQRDTRPPHVYEAILNATDAGEPSLASRVPVRFVGAPRLPLVVDGVGAVFADEAPQVVERASGAPRVESLELPKTLLQGAAKTMTVTWSAPEDNPADRIMITSSSRSGAWVVPLSAPSTQGLLELPIDLIANTEALTVNALPLQVSVLGTDSTSSPATQQELNVVMAPPAAVRVLLNWDGSADLDLGVTTPRDSHIDYVTLTADNGALEKDANSLCAASEIPLESIAWLPGNELLGEYEIDVSQYDPCGEESTDYEVTVLACGQSQTYGGSFEPNQGGTTVVQALPGFAVDCMHRVSGRVQFELTGTYSQVKAPAKHVPLRVTGLGVSEPVATTTNADGRYDVYLELEPSNVVSVEVDSRWTPPGSQVPRARVVDTAGGSEHTAISEVGEPSSTNITHDVLIDAANHAGAFNILDVLRQGYTWVDLNLDASARQAVSPIVARWSAGTETQSMGSYYGFCWGFSGCEHEGIWISGAARNPDEGDDSVIAHEFFHHVARRLGIDDSVGGAHSFAGHANPALAWSEGLATTLAQQTLSNPFYFDSAGPLAFWVDLESTANDTTQGMAYGTLPSGDMTGELNEFLVSGVLWDLLDPADEDPAIDGIDSAKYATLSTLTRYLREASFVDRGRMGKDLVDFLDGWRCHNSQIGDLEAQSLADTSLTNLLADRQFPYTPPTEEVSCN